MHGSGVSVDMLRTISSEQLCPGMYVQKVCCSWVEHPFWRTSFLAEEDEVARIRASRVTELVIDTNRGLDIPANPDAQSPAPADPARDTATDPAPVLVNDDIRVSLAAELARARQILEQGRDTVAAMFQEARLGRTVDPTTAVPLVEAINASVLRNPQALISLARLKTADDYTYLHSMAVAALMSRLARQLGLTDPEALEAAMGGLLHDMGKASTPLEILNKPGRLTDQEMEIVRLHPLDGHRLLSQAGVESAVVFEIALHHHEKMDGTGYPHRLAGEQISLMARMSAICDVYDAISSDRPYKRGWDPAESLKQMASWKGHFDPSIFNAFVCCLGIYPVGSLVRLASQKLAVVIEQNPGLLLKPVVRVFYSARLNHHMLVQDIDLSCSDCRDRIVQLESAGTWGFRDLDRLWMS
jgi:putative nucleotidyltransferase with HDIG domain